MTVDSTTPSELTGKEAVDSYLELYKFQWDRFDKRLALEWKVTLGLIIGIATATGYAKAEMKLATPVEVGYMPLCLYVLTWLVFTFVWSRGHWKLNEADRYAATQYRYQIETLLDYEDRHLPERLDRHWFSFLDWSRKSQSAAFGLTLVISYALMFSPLYSPHQ